MGVGTSTDERLQTLLEATVRLSESIDYARTLENVVRFVADRFASYALLDVVSEDGRIERVAVAHSDPQRRQLVERIREFNPPVELVETHPVSRAVARNEATIEYIDDTWIAGAAISQDHARTMQALEMRTLLVVPVTNGARVVGALTCVLDRHANRPAYDASDVAFAEELGRRAGVAIDNARLYEHERRIAFTLQAASLPSRLPESARLRLDAYYRPARTEAAIGGDWYDAFDLDDGRVALTMGDVMGKGLGAAVTMGRVRQAMQTAALLAPRADTMLDIADRTLRKLRPAAYATGFAAIFDATSRSFTCASAGHPAPLLRHPGGTIERLAVCGPMLGMGGLLEPGELYTFVAEPGSMLVCFTDGLIEYDRDIDEGERLLAAVLARSEIATHARPARALVDAIMNAHVPSDDIAVLTATVL